jgi:hypothetical protein
MKTNSIAELLKAKGIQVDPQPPRLLLKAMRLPNRKRLYQTPGSAVTDVPGGTPTTVSSIPCSPQKLALEASSPNASDTALKVEPILSQTEAKVEPNLGQTSDKPKTEPRTNFGQTSDKLRTPPQENLGQRMKPRTNLRRNLGRVLGQT